jgi:hypothetical protein
VDRAEFDRSERRYERLSSWLWTAWLVTAAIIGVVVGDAWTFAVGIPLAVALNFLGYWCIGRLVTRLWIRRFPEMADYVKPRVLGGHERR